MGLIALSRSLAPRVLTGCLGFCAGSGGLLSSAAAASRVSGTAASTVMVTDAELVRPRREDRARLLPGDASSVVRVRVAARRPREAGRRVRSRSSVPVHTPDGWWTCSPSSTAPAPTRDEIAVLISDDKARDRTDPGRQNHAGLRQRPSDGEPLRTGDIIPDIAAGPNGELYLVWQEATLAPSGSAIAFSKSVDGGLTWIPIRINTVAGAGIHPVDRGTARRHHRCAALRPAVQHTRPGHPAHRRVVPALPRRRRRLDRAGSRPSQLGHRMISSWGRTAGPSGLWPDEPAAPGAQGRRSGNPRSASRRAAPSADEELWTALATRKQAGEATTSTARPGPS